MLLLHNLLIAVGAGVLIASLVPVERLISSLPEGGMLRNWKILRLLVFFFIVCYIGYALVNWRSDIEARDMFVPSVFLLGSGFVFLVSKLSLQTGRDLSRIAVMEHENITDPLMGIFNRRFLDRRLREEVDRSVRYGLPLSVLLMDIDHFKQVNDMYGHRVGDRVLSTLGKLIQDTVRNTDVVARYGGEEILIIATCTPPPPVSVFAERLRNVVENAILVPASAVTCERDVQVTVSIGVSSIGPEIRSVDALLEAADQALYRAKNEGRNRVEGSEPEMAGAPSPGE